MRYKVIVSRKATEMLINHIRFLSFISVPASKALRDEFSSVLDKLKENPLQFQIEEDLNLPKNKYRRAIFAKRYKAVYCIEEKTVYIDAIIDCRQSLYTIYKSNFYIFDLSTCYEISLYIQKAIFDR